MNANDMYNVGIGNKYARFARLCLAAVNHPAGVVTRHICRQILKQRVRRWFFVGRK